MKSLLRALPFFRPDAPRIGVALLLLLLSTGANLLKPWPLALIIDTALQGKPLPAVMSWARDWDRGALVGLLATAIVVLYAGQGALASWQNYVSIQIGLRGLVRVRNQVFDWLQHLSLRYHQGQNQGDLIYRLSWDTYAFQTLFQQAVFTLFGASLSLLLMMLVMWRLDPPLARLAAVVIPLLILSMRFLGHGMSRRSLSAHQADSQVTSSIQQTIAALPVIQSYTREAMEQERFSDRVAQAYQRRVAQHGWEVLYSLVIAAGFGLATGLLAFLGALEVFFGRLSIGELLVFFGYFSQLYEPLKQLSHVGATVSDAKASVERVLELLDAPQELADAPNARPVISGSMNIISPMDGPESDRPVLVRGNLAFEHVSFAYEPDRPVLDDISFAVAAGESLALIGPSGAGKTTLLQLLPRFYDPISGRVLIEGADVRGLRLKDLRAQIALVPQEPILLPGTIADNIAYGRPGAAPDDIEAAAEAAHAAGFIQQLPHGYQTVVGEGAARLSVGEKQRINLARAFLKNAPIILLDEPTSALDIESEELVIRSLTQLIKGRTALIVAHRLSTVQRVDRVLVLERGQLIQSGRPSELLQADGYYARLMQGQLRGD